MYPIHRDTTPIHGCPGPLGASVRRLRRLRVLGALIVGVLLGSARSEAGEPGESGGEAGRLYVSADAAGDGADSGAEGKSGAGERDGSRSLGTRAAPFPNIQAAIDAVTTETEVVILPGVYSGPGNENITFRGKAITVRGEGGAEAVVIQDAGIDNIGSRGFTFDSGETRASVLESVTIRDFNANNDEIAHGEGGGILITNASSPSIRNCVVLGNHTRASVTSLGGGVGSIGGGICISGGQTLISGCVIEDNRSHGDWGDFGIVICINGDGGGMCIAGGETEIENTIIRGNYAASVLDCGTFSGGILAISSARVTIRDSLLDSNIGTGVYTRRNASALVTNSTFYDNSGGIYAEDGEHVVEHCTFAAQGSFGVSAYVTFGSVFVRSSLFWDNRTSDLGPGAVSLGHNLLEIDPYEASMESDLVGMDPFLGPLGDNGGPTPSISVPPGSPAIDAGDDANLAEYDQRGLPRRCDGDGDGILRSDIGAFEVQGAACRSARGDLLDLLLHGIPGAPDLNADGVVDAADLLLSERSEP